MPRDDYMADHVPCSQHFPSSSSAESKRPVPENAAKLDFTQRLENKLAKYNTSHSVLKRWLFEIIAWVVSALCLGAIVTIYIVVKERPLADLGSILTLTNILGKVETAALIIPTTEALGQLKWNWFHTSNAIWDFEIFDKATRGPWGAAMLLYRTKGRSLASLGAIIILLLLAIDSFLQQTVDLPERWILQRSSGRLRRTIRYDTSSIQVYSEGYPYITYESNAEVVTNRFFYGNGTQTVKIDSDTTPQIPTSCPTSNCTWPLYETLAVCNQCIDVSEYLYFACTNSTLDWTTDLDGGYITDNNSYNTTAMCGFFFNATSQAAPILMSGYLLDPETSKPGETLLIRTLPMVGVYDKKPVFGNGTIRFSDVRTPIADVAIASAADGSAESVLRDEKPFAQECALYWCVKTLRSTYDSGKYKEEVVATYTNTSKGEYPWIAYEVITPAASGTMILLREDVNIEVISSLKDDESSVNFGASNATAYNIMSIFDDFFPSFYTCKSPQEEPWLRFRTFLEGPPYLRRLKNNLWQAPNNVTRHMDDLATALSDVIRSAGDMETYLDGKAYTREVYVHIKWGWLAFPVVLLVLSLAFLVATIRRTSINGPAGVWKTSAMPALIYGLPKEAQTYLDPSTSWDGKNKEAKVVRAKLSPRVGWRVSGQTFFKKPTLPHHQTHGAPPGWI